MMISTEIEILETLYDDVQEFINTHPSWSNEGVMSEALKLFLISQKKGDRTEMIVCPNCGSHESAVVETTEIFDSYVHFCSKCGYTITESDWEKV